MLRRGIFLNHPGRKSGLTLVEMLVALGIAAALLAMALPSMSKFIARQRLVGVASELASDLRYARSEQMKASRPMRIGFASNAAKTCYMVHNFIQFTSCSCARSARPYCSAFTPGAPVPTELKTVDLPASDQVSVRPLTGTPSALVFESTTGLAISAVKLTIDVRSTLGGHLRVLTGAAGQPSICSVSGHAPRFPACPT